MASTLAISETTISNCRLRGSTATLRINYARTFFDDDGIEIPGGTQNFYLSIPCTINTLTHVLSIPAFSLPVTTNSLDVTNTANGRLYDARNTPRDWLFQQWSIPDSLAPTATWDALDAYNAGNALLNPPDIYLTADETTRLFNAIVMPLASETLSGKTFLSYPPADAARPEALGTNDPEWLRQDITTRNVTEYASLAAAISSIASTPTALLIPTAQTVSSNLTIPSTVVLKFEGTGAINVSGSSTVVTISGPIEAPLRPIFTGALVNSNIILSKRVPVVATEWFGLNTATAIQSAVNSIKTIGGIVELSTDYTSQTAPIWIYGDNILLRGAKHYQGTFTTISGTVRGPLVLLGQPSATPTFITSLATGAGQAIRIADLTMRPLNLGDGGTVNLNGLAAITEECFYKPSALTGIPGSPEYLPSSFGVRLGSELPTQAIAIRSYSDGSLEAVLTTTAGVYTITSAAGVLVVGSTSYIQASYDGATFRLFEGTPGGTAAIVASIAATGTVQQQIAEDVVLGAPPMRWPDASIYYAASVGDYDGVGFSNIARNVIAFTAPTAKRTADANTLIQCNFDNNSFPFIIADGPSGVDVYLVFRDGINGTYSNFSGIEGLQLSGHLSSGSGLYTFNSPNMRLKDLSATGRFGVLHLGQSFLSKFINIRATTDATAASRAGVVFTGTPSAGSTIDGMNIQGFPYGYVGISGPTRLDNCFWNTFTDSICPRMFSNPNGLGEVTLKNCWLDDETAPGVGVTRLAGTVMSELSGFNILGGFHWMTQVAVPLLIVDSVPVGFTGNIDGAIWEVHTSATEVVKFQGTAPVSPLKINGSEKFTSASVLSIVPWSTTMQYVEVDGIGLPVTAAQVTANQNNYNPGRKAKVIIISTDASRTITGLYFGVPALGGDEHIIYNGGSFPAVLAHNTTSTPAVRFTNLGAANITLAPGESAYLWYDGVSLRYKTVKLFNPDNPGAIGTTTPSTGAFTTVSVTGQITSTIATGTAPLVIASTTKVDNLNADKLDGKDFTDPGAIGGGTPAAGAFTTLNVSGTSTFGVVNAGAGSFTTLGASTSITVGNGTAITKIVKGAVTIDPASINATTVSAQTFTLTGATTADVLTLNVPAAGLTAGLLVLQAYVSAADTITIVFQNSTGAPIDEASASWRYILMRS